LRPHPGPGRCPCRRRGWHLSRARPFRRRDRPSFLLLLDPPQLLELAPHDHEGHQHHGGADADHDERRELHENNASRGSSCDSFCNSSSASRSFFDSFFGTLTRSRAMRSPLPLPPSFGAPWPRIRSNRPSCVPAGTFSDTRSPYGVGASTVAPSAASVYVTGTSIKRSAPRRSNFFDGSTRVTTNRSPAAPPASPSSPLSFSRIRVPSLTPAGHFTV